MRDRVWYRAMALCPDGPRHPSIVAALSEIDAAESGPNSQEINDV